MHLLVLRLLLLGCPLPLLLLHLYFFLVLVALPIFLLPVLGLLAVGRVAGSVSGPGVGLSLDGLPLG